MPRYIVEYKYGTGSYGNRIFDVEEGASEQTICSAAQQVIPNTAVEVLDIRPNDGTPLVVEAN